MLNLIIISTVILILAILIVIFRVATLVSVIKSNPEAKAPASNSTQALLMVLFLVFGVFGFFYYSFGGLKENFIQPIASEHGLVTERLFWITMAVTAFVFILTQILLFGFAYKYQYKENRKAEFYPHNNTLEIIWTAVPAVVLALLVFSGWKAWSDITGKAPEGTEIIEVMGYQYSWAVRYGGKDGKVGNYDYRKTDASNLMGIDFSDRASFDDFIPRELVIPKGRPVELSIRARDVIHSVYVPHFRLQMNAVPGMPTRFWFTATKTTEEMQRETGNEDFKYELVCNKICGKGHFAMKYSILVLEADEYDKWYASQEPWLKQNPEYMAEVPENLKNLALIAAGIENIPNNQAVEEIILSSSK